MTTTKPLWAAYLRVSSPTQAKRKQPNNPNGQGTLENQKEALAAWAERKGVTLKWYTDVMSGTKNMTQPNFQKMLAELESDGMVGIVVTAFDRLGRDGIGLMQLTRELKSKGKELTTLREGEQRLQSAFNSASDQLSRDIISIIAAYDRSVTVQKMKDGLDRYKANGGRVGRKPVVVDWNEADKLIKAGASSGLIARVLGINKHTARTKVRQRRAELGVIAPNTPKKNRKEKP